MLEDVSFTLEPGIIVGLIGPNGAGKTTLIRLLAGLLAPTSGEVLFDGLPMTTRSRGALRRIGLVPDKPGFYPQLSGEENLLFFGSLQGLGRSFARDRCRKLLHELDLSEAAGIRVGHYSQGMLQRLSVVRALLHDPEVLLLDEPIASVDPAMAGRIHALLRGLAGAGALVLLATHLLTDAQRLCDRVIFLRRRVVKQVEIRELRRRRCIKLQGKAKPHLELVRRSPGLRSAMAQGHELVLGLDRPDEQMPLLVRALVEAGAGILAVSDQGCNLQAEYEGLFEA